MAEARNNFLGSKMNKDLEQRLVPNNEYRNAENVMISRSDGDDVGSLENVLGNNLVSTFGLSAENNQLTNKVKVIGKLMDVANNRIYAFLTDYTDSSSDQLSNFAYSTAKCYICVYDITNNQGTILVEGYWLNFAQGNPIIGVNLINGLLFFTDNRNQPRKINVDKALNNPGPNGYYTCEDQISVAKYYPRESPLFINLQIINSVKSSGGGTPGPAYTVNQVLYLYPPIPPTGTITLAKIIVTSVDATTGAILTYRFLDLGNNYGLLGPGVFACNTASSQLGPVVGTALINITIGENSGLQDRTSPLLPDDVSDNPFYDPSYDGDKDFLKDKFVKFAWRMKFDDNEYSLISPFTQAAFVPKQDGYFITNDQEKSAYTSTELNFMENKVDYVRVVIKSPYKTWREAIERFKIQEIDVLYKQSNLTSINVVESIKVEDQLLTPYLDSEFMLYEYLSQKPFRTLPQKDLTRVYDKTPIRALSQEIAEDAVVYGNYLDKHTPPATLPYFVQASEKWSDDGSLTSGKTRIEYQNHTLKQNRNYQVGIVLSDRYGRQSSVLLSGDNKANTIYHPYRSGVNWNPLNNASGRLEDNFSFFYSGVQGDHLLTTNGSTSIPTDTWPGDSLKVTFSNTINSNKNSSLGTPGLYNDYGKVVALIITNAGTGYSNTSYTNLSTSKGGTGLGISITTTTGAVTGVTVTDPGVGFNIGDSLTLSGAGNNAVVKVIELEVPNPTGWYSYKVVVKQTQNEYYNVFTPGVLSGYIDGEGPNIGALENGIPVGATVSEPIIHLALFGDNINKVPRDLSQLGPTQASFRTGRPSYAEDPSYYDFVNTDNKVFSADPYSVEDQVRLKARDRARDLDSGSIITNSSVELYPRIHNYYAPGTLNSAPAFANQDGTYNIQGYFGTRTVEITTIGTGVELGLWDPSAAQPFNEAYSFFQFETNPLIARGEVPILMTDTSDDRKQAELNFFGVAGPSPFAGKVNFYSTGAYSAQGDNMLPGSKNVALQPWTDKTTFPPNGIPVFDAALAYTVDNGICSPQPESTYGDLGSKGTGLLTNIEMVDAQGFTTESGNPGLALDFVNPGKYPGGGVQGFMTIANPNGENGVKGFNVYGFPWHLQESSGVVGGANKPGATNFTYNLVMNVRAGDSKCRAYVTVALDASPGAMVPQLAVFETKPIESKLDIYWETSTSGLISELNTAVLENDTVTPVTLAGTYSSVSEVSPARNTTSGQVGNTYILQEIRALTQGGTEINFSSTSNASIELVSYYDGQTTTNLASTPSSDRLWNLEINTVNNRARVYLNIPAWYRSYTSVNLNTYSFNFRITSPSVNFPIDGTFITTDFTNLNNTSGEPYAITNELPNFQVSNTGTIAGNPSGLYQQIGAGGDPTAPNSNYDLGGGSSFNVTGMQGKVLQFTFQYYNGAYSIDSSGGIWNQSYGTNKDQEQYTKSDVALYEKVTSGSPPALLGYSEVPQSSGTYTVNNSDASVSILTFGSNFISTHGAGNYYIGKGTGSSRLVTSPPPVEVTDTDGTSKIQMNSGTGDSRILISLI